MIAKRRSFGILTGTPFNIALFCYFNWHGLKIAISMGTITKRLTCTLPTRAPEVNAWFHIFFYGSETCYFWGFFHFIKAIVP
jgi:hypothetical protein